MVLTTSGLTEMAVSLVGVAEEAVGVVTGRVFSAIFLLLWKYGFG